VALTKDYFQRLPARDILLLDDLVVHDTCKQGNTADGDILHHRLYHSCTFVDVHRHSGPQRQEVTLSSNYDLALGV
jgi:hypothetical protein